MSMLAAVLATALIGGGLSAAIAGAVLYVLELRGRNESLPIARLS